MLVLVAYASKYGSTERIAEFIADRLRVAGLEAHAFPVESVRDVAAYDAVLVGSATYMGHWLRPARDFVERFRDTLAGRPTWLFSSGPLGTSPIDRDGRDLHVTATPTEVPQLAAWVRARGHAVFFGVLDAHRLGLRDRAIRMTPVGGSPLPEGDFRNWREIDAWASSIAAELVRPRTAVS
jgi:menaquinone-dependent protoporphyrinogen oxidase